MNLGKKVDSELDLGELDEGRGRGRKGRGRGRKRRGRGRKRRGHEYVVGRRQVAGRR